MAAARKKYALPVVHASASTISENIPATMAAPGMVKIHAHSTLPATRQRTADIRRAAPTPTIPPVMVCVVETGMPCAEAKKSVAAAAVSAATPPEGCSLVSLNPIVFTIRHPPKSVP